MRSRPGAAPAIVVTFDDGPVDVPAKTVLLLHGIGVSSRYFHRLAPELAQDSRVIAVDLPGFGRAPKPGHRLTVEDFAGLVAAFIDSRGCGPVVVVGHSMGAQIATSLARQRPDLVTAVVLVGPVMPPADATPVRAAARLLVDTLRESPHSNALVFTDYVRCGSRWYLAVLPSMLAYRVEDDLPALAVPVTVVRGARDPIARAEWSRAITSLAVSGRFVEVPGAPHVVMLSHAREVAREVRRRLSPEESPTRQ
ncbi:alpha/beta fold hydrolase [Leifsonia sp. EB34]|uniref:alpha/beta fold hydrolase n=1 Tax=Leifsonia sp. EB34 TaxID=3156303 RepID=UPI003518273C